MDPKAQAEILKVGREWFVVVPQRVGEPLKFLCETLRDAERFLNVFNRTRNSAHVGLKTGPTPINIAR